MKDAISPVLSKNEPLSATERYRLAAEKATEILAERDREDKASKFDKDVQSYQVAYQSVKDGPENRASLGIKR